MAEIKSEIKTIYALVDYTSSDSEEIDMENVVYLSFNIDDIEEKFHKLGYADETNTRCLFQIELGKHYPDGFQSTELLQRKWIRTN